MSSARAAALARCVGDAEAFLADAWTRRPVHRAAADPDGFADLLTFDDVDAILTSSGLRAPSLRLVRGGTPIDQARYTRTARIGSRTVTDLIDPGRVLALHAEGATIVLQGLQRSWPPLRAFCRELELSLTHAAQANAYLTPPGAQGLRVHHDTHDVFALQTHGRKHWVVYEPHHEAPLPGQSWAADEAITAPVLDLDLHPGDALYVPRGTPHAAATVAEASLHITVGIVATTWHDVLGGLLDRAAAQPSLRAALPASWAADPAAHAPAAKAALDQLAEWIARQDAEEVLDATARRFWTSRLPALRGQLGELARLDAIDDATVVRARPLAVARIVASGSELVVLLGDRRLRLPGRVETAVRRLLDGASVRVDELSDVLDAEGRLVLVRRLVREGALVADA